MALQKQVKPYPDYNSAQDSEKKISGGPSAFSPDRFNKLMGDLKKSGQGERMNMIDDPISPRSGQGAYQGPLGRGGAPEVSIPENGMAPGPLGRAGGGPEGYIPENRTAPGPLGRGGAPAGGAQDARINVIPKDPSAFSPDRFKQMLGDLKKSGKGERMNMIDDPISPRSGQGGYQGPLGRGGAPEGYIPENRMAPVPPVGKGGQPEVFIPENRMAPVPPGRGGTPDVFIPENRMAPVTPGRGGAPEGYIPENRMASAPSARSGQPDTFIAGVGASTGNAASTASTANAQSSFDTFNINLPGISDATKSALSDLVNNGYTPSPAVDEALKELNDIIENRPEEFSSQWSGQIDAIMDQILNRKDFSYDFASDPTYQIYKDQYQRQGRMAMMDTMGQAAALTGGYGSSYASTAGNLAYQNSLANLNGIVPELQAQALNAYQAEGQKLKDAYALMSGERAQEQAEWQQGYDAWAADRDYYQNAYESAKQYDYGDYENKFSYYQDLANQESAQYSENRQYAYQTAISLLNQGKMPSSALLAAAGISKDDAKKLRK